MDKRILIVDDDRKLRGLLAEYFTDYGFQVSTLPDGREILKTIQGTRPDMIILDIMMPGKDGLETLREIRKAFSIPVIMLTARGDDADRIVGLELGADDYLPKPFNPRELLARVRAVLRRAGLPEPQDKRTQEGLVLRAGGLVLNKARRTVEVDGTETLLSTTEYELLKVLMEHPNRVLSRDALMNMARGRDFMAFDRSIDVHISKLRTKVGDDPRSPARIKTVWGTGYMFVDET